MKPAKSPKKPKKPMSQKLASPHAPHHERAKIWSPSIVSSHYTPQGEHPEDRIYRDREYIQRLQKHLHGVYDKLEGDLGIKGESDWLFDFVFNEDRNMEFEDYLCESGIQYKDIVGSKKSRSLPATAD